MNGSCDFVVYATAWNMFWFMLYDDSVWEAREFFHFKDNTLRKNALDSYIVL